MEAGHEEGELLLYQALEAARSPGSIAYRRAEEALRRLSPTPGPTRIPAEVTITTDGDRRTVIQKHPDRTIKEIFDRTTGELIQRWVWPKKE